MSPALRTQPIRAATLFGRYVRCCCKWLHVYKHNWCARAYIQYACVPYEHVCFYDRPFPFMCRSFGATTKYVRPRDVSKHAKELQPNWAECSCSCSEAELAAAMRQHSNAVSTPLARTLERRNAQTPQPSGPMNGWYGLRTINIDDVWRWWPCVLCVLRARTAAALPYGYLCLTVLLGRMIKIMITSRVVRIRAESRVTLATLPSQQLRRACVFFCARDCSHVHVKLKVFACMCVRGLDNLRWIF